MTRDEAVAFRAQIEESAAYLPDDKAAEKASLFPAWDATAAYAVGDRVRYGALLYKCLTAHTAQADWTPESSPSLWARIDDPAVEWPQWRQPTTAETAYPIGAKVSHGGKRWISLIDANTTEPGTDDRWWKEYKPETI